MARNANNCSFVLANPQTRSPPANSPRQISNKFFLPKMSESRPLMSWKAVAAMRNEAPIQEVAEPVFKSADIAGIAVETLVWSRKETNNAMDSAGNAMRICLVVNTFRWPPMLCASELSSSLLVCGAGDATGSARSAAFFSSLMA